MCSIAKYWLQHNILLTKETIKRELHQIIVILLAIQDKKDCLTATSAKQLVDGLTQIKTKTEYNLNIGLLFNSKALADSLDESLELFLTIGTKIGIKTWVWINETRS